MSKPIYKYTFENKQRAKFLGELKVMFEIADSIDDIAPLSEESMPCMLDAEIAISDLASYCPVPRKDRSPDWSENEATLCLHLKEALRNGEIEKLRKMLFFWTSTDSDAFQARQARRIKFAEQFRANDKGGKKYADMMSSI